MEEINDIEEVSSELRALSVKLRALGYLVENNDNQGAAPLDIDDINLGLGILISQVASDIKACSQKLEDHCIENSMEPQKSRRDSNARK